MYSNSTLVGIATGNVVHYLVLLLF